MWAEMLEQLEQIRYNRKDNKSNYNEEAKSIGFKNNNQVVSIKKIVENGVAELIKAAEDKRIGIHPTLEIIKLSDDDQRKAVERIYQGTRWYMYEYPDYLVNMYINKECNYNEVHRLYSFVKHSDYKPHQIRKELKTFRDLQMRSKLKAETEARYNKQKTNKPPLAVAMYNIMKEYNVNSKQAKMAVDNAIRKMRSEGEQI